MSRRSNIQDIEIPPIRHANTSASIIDASIVQSTYSNSGTQTTNTSVVNVPTSSSLASFTAWSRVFFQSRDDRGSRQVLPSHCPTYTSNSNTYLYVIIDMSGQHLYLYPDENKLNHHKPIVDIDLKYFDAEVLPNSHSCVALYARTESYDGIEGNNSDTNSPTNKTNTNTQLSSVAAATRTPSKKKKLIELKRYVFRFEFLNTVVRQSRNRIHSLQVSGRNVKRYQNPKMITKFNTAGKKWFASHDDVEENRKIEHKKNIDAHNYHMTLIEEFVSESAALANRFTKICNSASTKPKNVVINPLQSTLPNPYEDENMNEVTNSNFNFQLEEVPNNDPDDVFFDSDDESSEDDLY